MFYFCAVNILLFRFLAKFHVIICNESSVIGIRLKAKRPPSFYSAFYKNFIHFMSPECFISLLFLCRYRATNSLSYLCNCEILCDRPHSFGSVSLSMTECAKKTGRGCVNCGAKFDYQLYVHVGHTRLIAE